MKFTLRDYLEIGFVYGSLIAVGVWIAGAIVIILQ